MFVERQMRLFHKRLVLLLASMLCGALAADRAEAQVVQLPTWEFHAAPATILVPDSGGAALGGIRRARGQAARAPGARGVAAARGATGANATAVIQDLAELDRRVLAQAANRRREAGRSLAGAESESSEALKKSRSIASPTSSAEQAVESLAEIRRRRSATKEITATKLKAAIRRH
jgi:hypothetical protein